MHVEVEDVVASGKNYKIYGTVGKRRTQGTQGTQGTRVPGRYLKGYAY